MTISVLLVVLMYHFSLGLELIITTELDFLKMIIVEPRRGPLKLTIIYKTTKINLNSSTLLKKKVVVQQVLQIDFSE